jgi:uncharacterized protein
MLTPELVLIFAAIIFLGFFIKSATGFAGALFSVPLLALLYDIKFVVYVVSLVDMTVGLMLFPQAREKMSLPELRFLVPGILLGAVLGVFILHTVEGGILKQVFGVVVILFALRILLQDCALRKELDRRLGTLFGFFGGVTGALFSTNGPPVIFYLEHQLKGKEVFRATVIAALLTGTLWRNTLYLATGLFTETMGLLALSLLPVLFLAKVLGTRAHHHICEERYRSAIGVILLISGCLLLLA